MRRGNRRRALLAEKIVRSKRKRRPGTISVACKVVKACHATVVHSVDVV